MVGVATAASARLATMRESMIALEMSYSLWTWSSSPFLYCNPSELPLCDDAFCNPVMHVGKVRQSHSCATIVLFNRAAAGGMCPGQHFQLVPPCTIELMNRPWSDPSKGLASSRTLIGQMLDGLCAGHFCMQEMLMCTRATCPSSCP